MNQNENNFGTMNLVGEYCIYDQWKREYHFKIKSFLVPTGVAYEAIEIKENNSNGYYSFNYLSSFDVEPEIAIQTLILKIKKGLNQRHLKKSGNNWVIGKRDILRGRIEWAENLQDTSFDKVLIIDGQKITIEEFGRLLEPFEGAHFEFKIKDPYD